MLKWFNLPDVWDTVKAAARTTIRKDGSGKYPDDGWKKSILLAEHSPIRKIHIAWKWSGLLSWVSVHFVRHKIGIEHYVSTQRTDRTGVNRDDLPQSAPVDHECDADAQAVINISRKRLCTQASKQTRDAWKEVVEAVGERDAVLASVCVPECVYRGFCPEFEPCPYIKSEAYRQRVREYRGGRPGYGDDMEDKA